MSDQLTEAEELCKKTLNVLQTIKTLPNEKNADFEKEILDLIGRLMESKKKIMVHSPEGRILSTEIFNSASKTYETVFSRVKNRGDLEAEEVTTQLSQLRDRIERLEIYWKSFEYVTT
ncbi:MAG: hypothetical protein QG670_2440 [Thermoproteota archaeon]|nr:hypothetical protein [Thermoproteota archaeon]